MKTTFEHAGHRHHSSAVFWRWIFAVTLACLCNGTRLQAAYSLDWASVDGGSCTTTGGVYAITGTIGQSDASQSAGGVYQLAGGFWSFLHWALPPERPGLTIVLTISNTLVISWPFDSQDLALEEKSDVVASDWRGVLEPPVLLDGRMQVIIVPSSEKRFYRLKRM